jgi:predicted nucleic acid-binding protein
VILAYFLGEKIGALARSEIFEPAQKTIYHNRLCIAELFYVLCRRRGIKAATDYVHAFLDAGHSVLSDSDEIVLPLGRPPPRISSNPLMPGEMRSMIISRDTEP